jgi:hypothetical protein
MEDFQGWEKGPAMDDVSFIVEQNEKIKKIAIVGEKKWKEDLLLFAGAGYRLAQVGFFPLKDLEEAKAWVKA